MHDTDWHAAVVALVEIVDADPEIEDEDIAERLQQRGLTLGAAWATTVLVPLAFGRAVIETLGVRDFSATFVVQEEPDGWVELSLRDQPVYVDAAAVGRCAMKHELMDRDRLLRIASRSGEMSAVSHVLESGDTLEGGRFATPVVFAPASYFVRPRPWWKFWAH